MYRGRSSCTLRISRGLANREDASRNDCIESGLSDGKQSGSLMKASTSALSRLIQSNGVRAGSNAAFIHFIRVSSSGTLPQATTLQHAPSHPECQNQKAPKRQLNDRDRE